jgi:hypothetical protein
VPVKVADASKALREHMLAVIAAGAFALRDTIGKSGLDERVMTAMLACQRHDGDAADAALRGTDTRPEPDAQIAVGLIAQPQPGEFDPGGSPLAVAGLADPLIMGHVSASFRTNRQLSG